MIGILDNLNVIVIETRNQWWPGHEHEAALRQAAVFRPGAADTAMGIAHRTGLAEVDIGGDVAAKLYMNAIAHRRNSSVWWMHDQ